MHGKIHDSVECGFEAIFGTCAETGGAGESVCWDMRRKLREREVEGEMGGQDWKGVNNRRMG